MLLETAETDLTSINGDILVLYITSFSPEVGEDIVPNWLDR